MNGTQECETHRITRENKKDSHRCDCPFERPPQWAVSRILFPSTRQPCGGRAQDDNHSSSPAIAGGIEQPTRKLRTGRPRALPYLALLRAGFCLPPVLPRARCALTAPFHPYSPSRLTALRRSGIFSVPLVLRVAPTGRYPAHCPAEFGLSSRPPSPRFALSGYGETTRDRRSSSALRPLDYPSDSWVIAYCSSFL